MESRKQEISILTEDQEAPISLLVNNTKLEICQYLNGVDGFNLLLASPRLFAPANRDIIVKRADHPLRKLLSHGALGELAEAENIWRAFPDLLTCRGTIYHPNRIYVEGQPPVEIPFHQNLGRDGYDNCSFYQILLMNEEFEEAEEAGKLMTEEEKQKQFYEIFPDGKIVNYNFSLETAKKLLRAVFTALINDQCVDENDLDKMSESTRTALYALYDYAKPNPKHKTGLVFDPNFYIAALKFYDDDDTFKQFKNWQQCTFWCIRVEEALVGRLGTGFLRSHSQGIGNPLTRVGCVMSDGSSYFPFRRRSDAIPGFHILVDYWDAINHARPHATHSQLGMLASRIFETFCQAKTRAKTDFMRQFARPEASSCLIL